MSNAAFVTLAAFAALALAYRLYGRFLARRVFQLDPNRTTPAHARRDGVDFVPTRVPVLFGHHFASIAGLGPILGPAIAVIWGWVPALLWVVFGSILIGAVHDLGAMAVSLRSRGRSIGDVCREIIGPRARLLFLLIIFFLLSLAMGVFVNAISSLFVRFNPDAVIPSFGLMLVAMAVGVAVYLFRVRLAAATAIGLVAFGGLIVWGEAQPVRSYQWFLADDTRQLLDDAPTESGDPAAVVLAAPYGSASAEEYLVGTGRAEAADELRQAESRAQRAWIFVLLAYGFAASVLPVWLLLQPRDYINSFQLYFALGLLVLGLCIAAALGREEATIQAPAFNWDVADAPPILPFLFITVACGAISGFHSLVSSGTTVRQMNRETDALPIGFGGMLTEGALAVLVIMACVAGLGAAAWGPAGPYAAWNVQVAAQLNAVVTGGANFLAQVGVPAQYGMAFLAVTIVAFAMTTLDSATRLLRFNVEEIFRSLRLQPLANRYVASLVAVAGIATFGLPEFGKSLWVMFGTTNQLLAGLTLLTVSLFLYKLGRPVIYTFAPMVVMLALSLWAMLWQLSSYLSDPAFWDYSTGLVLGVITVAETTIVVGLSTAQIVAGTTVVLLLMTAWLIVEAVVSFTRGRESLDLLDAPPAPPAAEVNVADAARGS